MYHAYTWLENMQLGFLARISSSASRNMIINKIVACNITYATGHDDGFDYYLFFSLESKKSLVLEAIKMKCFAVKWLSYFWICVCI